MACIKRIIQGVPPTDLSALNISLTLRGMLEQCWNQDPLSRSSADQCISIVGSVLHELEPLIPQITSSRYGVQHVSGPSSQVPGMMEGYHENWDSGTNVLSMALPSTSTIALDNETLPLWGPSPDISSTRLEGHSGTIYGLAFIPDGSILASASSDHTLRMWDRNSKFGKNSK